MNKFLFLVGILVYAQTVLTAGDHSARSSSRSSRSEAVQNGRSITFSRDDRPVDGALTEITIVDGVAGWTAQKRTVRVDRRTGKEIEKTDTLADMLKCKIEALQVVCTSDLRPVDGVLTEIKIISGIAGWTAEKRTVSVDRRTGKEIVKTEKLGSLLNRKG